MLAGARCGRLLSEARSHYWLVPWLVHVYGKSIMGVAKCTRRAQLGACAHSKKMASFNEPNNQRRRKSLVTTGEAVIKQSWHRNALYKMELIYAKTKIRS